MFNNITQQQFPLVPFHQMLRQTGSSGYPNMSFYNPGQMGADPYGQPFQQLPQRPHRFPTWMMGQQNQPRQTSFFGRRSARRWMRPNRPRPTQQQLWQKLQNQI